MSTNAARERPRFYAPALDPEASEVALPEDEARHLTRVLRLGAGDEVYVFDGRGAEYRARVIAARGADVRLALLEPVRREAAAGAPFTLVQAVLKGPAMDDVIRDATMLGAAAIQPLVTAYTDAGAALVTRASTRGRWERIAVASAKQCRRAALPAIAAPLAFDAWLTAPTPPPARFLFAEPAAGSAEPALAALLAAAPDRPSELVVGPEGGWAPGEVEAARRAGCRIVRLGGLTLRAAAVPLAAMTLFVAAGDARA
jgi:16S rRNA (uracil1498-N3)-methyltransferase